MVFHSREVPKRVQDLLRLFSQFAQGALPCEAAEPGQAQPALRGAWWIVDSRHARASGGSRALTLSMSSNQKQSEACEV